MEGEGRPRIRERDRGFRLSSPIGCKQARVARKSRDSRNKYLFSRVLGSPLFVPVSYQLRDPRRDNPVSPITRSTNIELSFKSAD